MNTKLQYDLHEIGDASQKAIVAIHGWQGDRNSMFPLIKSINIKNVGWYLLEAPFPVKNREGFIKLNALRLRIAAGKGRKL